MSKLIKAHERFLELDEQLKALEAELEADEGEAGAAFRHRQQLVEEWRVSVNAVRAEIQNANEGVGKFSLTRRRSKTVDVGKAEVWLRDRGHYDEMVSKGVVQTTTNIDVKALEKVLSEEDFDAIEEEAIETKVTLVIRGPKAEDVL